MGRASARTIGRIAVVRIGAGLLETPRCMGLDYAFNLFVHDASIPLLLRSLQPLLAPVRAWRNPSGVETPDSRTTLVVDGQSIELACSSGFAHGAIVELLQGQQSATLELAINFPWEDELSWEFDSEADGLPIPIGYIYVTIERAAQVSRVVFCAATTHMSLHFQRSPSIRGTFAALAKHCGAVLVALYLEEDGFETLEAAPRRALVRTDHWSADDETYLGELDPPALLASILAALDRQRWN